MEKYVLDALRRIISNNGEKMEVRLRAIELLKQEPDDTKIEGAPEGEIKASAKEALAEIMEDSAVNGPVRSAIAEVLGYQIEF